MAQKTFRCEDPTCNRPFASEHGRNTHMRIVHHREPSSKQRTVADSIPPLPEPIVGGPTKIIQGIEVAELPDGSFQCPKCPSTSKNSASMSTHLRANHGIRMHAAQECPVCHESFSGKGGLTRHVRTAHPDQADGPGAAPKKLKPTTVQTPTTQPHPDLTPQVILEIIRIQREAAINARQQAADELSDAIRKLIS